MSFVSDLKVGRGYEEVIKETLNKVFNLGLINNPNNRGIDLVSESIEFEVEIKFDRQWRTTWNIFIEYECNKKPSWIKKYWSNNFLFVYWDNEDAYIFDWQTLSKKVDEFVKTKQYKLVNWWDGWRVKGVLIPIKDLEEIAQWKLFIKNTILWQATLSQNTTDSLMESQWESTESTTTTENEDLK